MENSKRLKELKKQLTLLQEEIYADHPSGFSFKVIMENMDSLIDPTAREAYDKIWEFYNKAPDCCTEDGEPYKDFNEYICKDLRKGNIRDAILNQIFVITRESNIELRDTSLDTVTKTDECKTYFMLRYIYNDLCLPTISFVQSDGKWIPVDMNYLYNIKRIFESLKDHETTNLFTELISGIKVKRIVGNSNEIMAALCQAPEFPCAEPESIESLIASLKEKIDAETDPVLINATNGILEVMSFGKYDINGVGRMINL